MNSMVPYTFAFEESTIRAVLRDDDPWFVGKDVCAALNLKNPNQALSRLDADEKGVTNVDPLSKSTVGGGAQEMTIISEPGVYRLVFTSRTDKAEAFKRWLAHEVLPQLRRNGFFSLGGTMEDNDAVELYGVPLRKAHLALKSVSLANTIAGPRAALEVWRFNNFPEIGAHTVGALAGSAKDDPQGCLRFLLSLAVRSGLSVGEVLHNSLHDALAARSLKEFGILVSPDGFDRFVAVANAHSWLLRSFIETQWQGDWRLALARLPGARPSPGAYRFGAAYSKAVLIPRDVVLDARSGVRH